MSVGIDRLISYRENFGEPLFGLTFRARTCDEDFATNRNRLFDCFSTKSYSGGKDIGYTWSVYVPPALITGGGSGASLFAGVEGDIEISSHRHSGNI